MGSTGERRPVRTGVRHPARVFHRQDPLSSAHGGRAHEGHLDVHTLLSGPDRREAHVIVMRAPYNGPMRVLGIDPGGKRLGLAVGDDLTGTASPLGVVPYTSREHAGRAIAEAMDTHGAEMAVIGLPTTVDGKETPACRRSHALLRALADLGIESVLQPEVLTTNEARRRARSVGRPSSQPVDDIAAQVILEDYLAGQANNVARP